MIDTQKLVALLLLEGVLAGAAGAGGMHYWSRAHDKTPTLLKECQAGREQLDLSAKRLYIRGLLLESAIGLERGNGGFAFERLVRAEAAAMLYLPTLKKDFAVLSSLMLNRDPMAKDVVVRLAEKVVPTIAPVAEPPGAQAPQGTQPGAAAAPAPAAAPTPAAPAAQGAPPAGAR